MTRQPRRASIDALSLREAEEKAIKQRLAQWESSELESLWQSLAMRCAKRRGASMLAPAPSLSARNARRAKKRAQQGRHHDAVAALQSKGLAPINDRAHDPLQQKRPGGPTPRFPAPPPESPITIDRRAMLSALRSFKKAAAPGPSGLKAQHIEGALCCPLVTESSQTRGALTSLISKLAKGSIPERIKPALAGAALIALPKSDHGRRPIAKGEALRRLVAKCLAQKICEPAAQLLAPTQVGVGISKGAEAMMHAVRAALQRHGLSPQKAALKVDFQSAFNRIDRQSFMQQCRAHFPDLSQWVEAMRSSNAALRFGDRAILSRAGAQQGGPLGPFLFSLALALRTQDIKSSLPQMDFQCWRLDDGVIQAPPTTMGHAISQIQSQGPKRGLHLNLRKCELWWPSASPECANLPPEISRARDSGISLLGAPIGDQDFCARFMPSKLDNIRQAQAKLHTINHAQTELALLRSCMGMTKFSRSLRACPPSHIGPSLAEFDESLRDALEEMLCASLTHKAWQQATLPTTMAGLGMRAAANTACSARASSLIHCRSLVEQMTSMGITNSHTGVMHAISHICASQRHRAQTEPQRISIRADLSLAITQHSLSAACDKARCFRFLRAVSRDARDKARMQGLSLPCAGAFLNVAPMPSLGLTIDSQARRALLRCWLGIPFPGISSGDSLHTCLLCKKNEMGRRGGHALVRRKIGMTARHNRARDAILQEAKEGRLSPQAEKGAGGASARPGDVFTPAWKRNRPVMMDIKVAAALRISRAARSAQKPGEAARLGRLEKLRKHEQDCLSHGFDFVPMVVETLGGWAPESLDAIRLLAERKADARGMETPVALQRFLQSLSLALQKANARMLLLGCWRLPQQVVTA